MSRTSHYYRSLVVIALTLTILAILWAGNAFAFTANKVWFEFRRDGRYRIHVNYTLPELKEFRDAYVDFTTKKDAERFYWDLVRGADFYLPVPASRRFVQTPLTPDPW